MALLPYSVRQVTQRKGGGRRDRGDRGGDRDEFARGHDVARRRPMPTPRLAVEEADRRPQSCSAVGADDGSATVEVDLVEIDVDGVDRCRSDDE